MPFITSNHMIGNVFVCVVVVFLLFFIVDICVCVYLDAIPFYNSAPIQRHTFIAQLVSASETQRVARYIVLALGFTLFRICFSLYRVYRSIANVIECCFCCFESVDEYSRNTQRQEKNKRFLKDERQFSRYYFFFIWLALFCENRIFHKSHISLHHPKFH